MREHVRFWQEFQDIFHWYKVFFLYCNDIVDILIDFAVTVYLAVTNFHSGCFFSGKS